MLDKETFAAFSDELEKIAVARQTKNILSALERINPGAVKQWRRARVTMEFPEFTEKYLQKHKSLLPKETVKQYREANLAPTMRLGSTRPWTKHISEGDHVMRNVPLTKGRDPYMQYVAKGHTRPEGWHASKTLSRQKLLPWGGKRPKWSQQADQQLGWQGAEIPLRRFVFGKYYKRTTPGVGDTRKWVGSEPPTRRRYENIISKAEDQSKGAIEKAHQYKDARLRKQLGRRDRPMSQVELDHELKEILRGAQEKIEGLPLNVGYSPFYGRLPKNLDPAEKLSILTRGHRRGVGKDVVDPSYTRRLGTGPYARGGATHKRSGSSAPVDIARSRRSSKLLEEFQTLSGTKAVPRETAIAKKHWSKAVKKQFRKDKRKAFREGWEWSGLRDLWTRPGSHLDEMVAKGPVPARFKTTAGRKADIKAQLAREWTGLHGAKKGKTRRGKQVIAPTHPKGIVAPLLSRRYSMIDPSGITGKGKKGLMFRGTTGEGKRRGTDPHEFNVFMTRHPEIATGYGASSAWRGFGSPEKARPRLEVFRSKKLRQRGETPHLAKLRASRQERKLIEELRKLPPDSLRALAVGQELKTAGKSATGVKPTYEDVINLESRMTDDIIQGPRTKERLVRRRKARRNLEKAFVQGYEMVPVKRGKTPVGLEIIPVGKSGEKGKGISLKRLLEAI